ncbi:MAG: hypothetical protein JSU07_10100 [Bacteroidetes bacterium]|nr:hypothetical protein [Bacteroidota bacterium]
MEKLLMNILSFGLKPLYEKNIAYYNLVKDFRNKLPRHQHQAKKLSKEEIEKHPFLPKSAQYVTVVDTSTHKPDIKEADIDQFYNKINDLDYTFVFFKKHYKAHTADLNRLNPKSSKGNLDLIVLQKILQDDALHPLKPLDVAIYHVKYKLKISKVLLWLLILLNSGVFVLYGIAKLIGFQFVYHAPAPDKLLQDVSPLGIMWYFFSLKKGYAILVALSEIIPAILILFKRTRFIGAVLYLITVTNILAINIFFGITPWTLGISIVLFINILIILISERQKLKMLLS